MIAGNAERNAGTSAEVPVEAPSLDGTRLVVVTNSRVWSPGEGRSVRFTGLVAALVHRGMRVDFLTSRTHLSDEDMNSILATGVSSVISGTRAQEGRRDSVTRKALHALLPTALRTALRGFRRKLRFPRRPARGNSRPAKLSDVRDPALISMTRDYIERHHPDFCLVEYVMHTYVLDCLKDLEPSSRPITMIDTHDVQWQKKAELRDRGLKTDMMISQEEETGLLKKYDVIIAITEEDKQEFVRSVPGDGAVVFCPPVWAVAGPPPARPEETKRLMFVAGDSAPNALGIEDFLLHAWPIIAKVHPDAVLRVVGSVSNRMADCCATNVICDGFVEDLSAAYRWTDIVIAPVTVGGGLKIKVVEALANGRPVIATSHSAVGLRDAIGNGLIHAADWTAFAQAANDLLADAPRRNRLGTGAFDFVRERFNEYAAMKELVNAMSRAMKRRTHVPNGYCADHSRCQVPGSATDVAPNNTQRGF